MHSLLLTVKTFKEIIKDLEYKNLMKENNKYHPTVLLTAKM